MVTEAKIIPGSILLQEQIKSKTSNNMYDVIFFDNCVVCTCPAGGKKQLCKHIIRTFHSNFEYIKEKSPVLFQKLINALEIKDDKNIPREEKMKIYAKVIFLNKEIAQIAHENTLEIINSDEREFEELKTILDNDTGLASVFYNIISTARKDPYSIFVTQKSSGIQQLLNLQYLSQYDLSEKIYKKFKIAEKAEYAAFAVNEILYTNKLIWGYAEKLRDSAIEINFRLINIGADCSIKLK